MWRAVVVLAVLVVAAKKCGGRGSSAGDDDRVAIEADIDTARYTPEGDEGLGASVAIVLDNSGSMSDEAEGDKRPKYIVAREALEAMLAATDSFVAKQPDFPINVGLYRFASRVTTVVPVQRYDRAKLLAALDSIPEPDGGTAIGDAMDQAREDLYRAGTIRKYLLVVTDGENTAGRSPKRVAREIAARSGGAVRMYFVAFDIDAETFGFVRDVRGEVVGASNGIALKASLDTIYRGKILAESVDAGESLPDSTKKTLSDSTTKRVP
jgi:von Willebrand factor type A domain-containing protein